MIQRHLSLIATHTTGENREQERELSNLASCLEGGELLEKGEEDEYSEDKGEIHLAFVGVMVLEK